MPESYTYVAIATKALMRSGQNVASIPAYQAGANGPDILAMYKFFKKKKQPDLPALSKRIHREKTGLFLYTLFLNAITPVQQSYALGFLTHYISDCTIHPYMAAVGTGQYAGKEGQCLLATSMDSTLYYNDYKSYLVPLHAGTSVLVTEDLAQVTSLLHDALLHVYELDIPTVALADAFHDNMSVRKFMISKKGFKKRIAKVFGTMLAGKTAGKLLYYRMQPGKPLAAFPETWVNPYSKEQMHLTFDEVIALAEQTSAACIAAVMGFWLGNVSDEALIELLGDNNYYTGLPSRQDPPQQPAPVSPQAQTTSPSTI